MDMRRIAQSDLLRLFEWRNDPRVFKTCRQREPLHWANHVAWFERQSKDPSMSMFVVLGDDGKAVGVTGLTDIDLVNRRAEFSLYIDPDLHGRGLGTRALKTILKYGFSVLGLNLIWGETFAGNSASRTFETLGMVKEGTRRDFYYRCGDYIDAHLYSIRRQEWEQRHS
jgi:UDP-4-amino-4,6-dideoxy-N-acetyl-beta-L-altrosamine N-acetyltransferase